MTNPGQLGPMEWMSFGLSFAFVLLTIGALYFLFHRFVLGTMPRRAEPRIKVLETLAVGPRQKIVLLRLGQREVLVGVTAQQMSALSEWPVDPATLAATTTVGESLAAQGAAGAQKSLRNIFNGVNFRRGTVDKRL